MTSKRRNNGRALKGRGKTRPVRCDNCGKSTPKDKAIRKFLVRPMVESAAVADIKGANAYEEEYPGQLPKMYLKLQYCISCAIHGRIVRVRSKEGRKIRDAPIKPRKKSD
ncbi:hypothetical protein ABK040_010054 [Willaertia magna]